MSVTAITTSVVSSKPAAVVSAGVLSTRTAAHPVAQFIAPPPGRDFYFGYGANMAPRVVQRRNLFPKGATAATLHNHKLYFNHVGGYGSIEYRPEDTTRPDVHGVLLDLSQEEMRSLANTEQGYDVRSVVVSGADGKRYAAKAFMSNWSVRLFKETLPTQDYIGKLQEGAEIHELPAEYQAWLKGIDPRSKMLPSSDDEEIFASPGSFLAVGFSTALFFGACMLLVGPRR